MIVCNRCLLFKSDSPDQRLSYHIANCGHVYCANCKELYRGCHVCQNPDVRFTVINDSMKPDMKLFLTSPDVLCRAFEQSLSFQNMQMNLFEDFSEKKINAMQKAVQNMEKDCVELTKMASRSANEANILEAENAKLETELKNLEMEVRSMQSSLSVTPTNFTSPQQSRRVTKSPPGFTPSSRRGLFARTTPNGSQLRSRDSSMDRFIPDPSTNKPQNIFSSMSIMSNLPSKWI